MDRRTACAPDRAAIAAALPNGELVVTGGAGFVGSHLVELLLDCGRRVHVVDDLSSGALDNLAAVHGHPSLRLTIGSCAEPAIARRACGAAAAVFHLAGMVGVQRLCREPLEVMQRNLDCTRTMLDAAAAARVPILITSSSEVYGDGPVPFRETAAVRPGPTQSVRGGYACAKAMGEWLAQAHAQQHGLPAVVVRLFNVVGPRQSGAYGMVLPRFLAQAFAGEPLTVFGDGTQTRCFAAVDEVVAALAQLLSLPAARGLVVNVGSDQEVAVAELAAIVRRTVGATGPIRHVPLAEVFPSGFVDPPRRVPCLDRLRALLGWAPCRPVAAIVGDLVAAQACPGQAARARA